MARPRDGCGPTPPRQVQGEIPGEVLFEWRAVGDSVRVAAIDPASGIEVVVFGPAAAGVGALRSLAKRKLLRRLGQRSDRPL